MIIKRNKITKQISRSVENWLIKPDDRKKTDCPFSEIEKSCSKKCGEIFSDYDPDVCIVEDTSLDTLLWSMRDMIGANNINVEEEDEEISAEEYNYTIFPGVKFK